MLYKYGKRTRNVLGSFLFLFYVHDCLYFEVVLNKTIVPLAFVGYEMNIANSALFPIQHALVR